VLSFLVHAGSKIGKTTLASSCPKPMLVFDAEGGSKFLPLRKVFWDPQTQGAPPVWDGTWDMCVVVVRQFDTMAMAYNWLASGQHSFASLVVDSISEIQRRLKESLVGTEAMKTQDWGVLLVRMEMLIRQFRDLTLHPTNPFSVAMFIAETREDNKGKYKPYLQGAMAVTLPYLMDVIGYLYVQDVPNQYDPTQPGTQVRALLVSPHPLYDAGERVQGRLGQVVYEPNVETMLAQVYAQPTNQQPAAAPAV
jgi:hypothetical protein